MKTDKPLTIAGRQYQSRLIVGTGKYRDMAQTRAAVLASGAQIVTAAVRRVKSGAGCDLLQWLASEFQRLYQNPICAPIAQTSSGVMQLHIAYAFLKMPWRIRYNISGLPCRR